jgi:predicted transposase YdaD
MWKEPLAAFLQGGLGLLPLAPLCQMPTDKPLTAVLREVVREIDRRLLQETDHAQAVRLMTAAFILTGLRVDKQELANIYDGVRVMHESTAYDMILDEGRAEGRVEGRIEGRLEGEIRLLLRQGRKRFGPPDPATEATLSSIQDVERLERMGEALLSVDSWQALLATP